MEKAGLSLSPGGLLHNLFRYQSAAIGPLGTAFGKAYLLPWWNSGN